MAFKASQRLKKRKHLKADGVLIPLTLFALENKLPRRNGLMK